MVLLTQYDPVGAIAAETTYESGVALGFGEYTDIPHPTASALLVVDKPVVTKFNSEQFFHFWRSKLPLTQTL